MIILTSSLFVPVNQHSERQWELYRQCCIEIAMENAERHKRDSAPVQTKSHLRDLPYKAPKKPGASPAISNFLSRLNPLSQ